MKHIELFRDPARFAGWPANYGIWAWENEVVVGFTVGTPQMDAGFHARTREYPFTNLQVRSLDGGNTWTLEDPAFPSPGGRGVSADEHMVDELSLAWAIRNKMEPLPRDCPGGIDFTHPDFALMCARTGLGTGTESWFYVSCDRAHTWEGPYRIPSFGLPGIEARTDYLINGPEDGMLFLTASRADGNEGAGVFLARTLDGGKSFALQSWVCETPDVMSIMPSSLRTGSQRILTAVRCAARGEFAQVPAWIDLYVSADDGDTFQYLNRPAPDTGKGGNPPVLSGLADGRIVLTYGARRLPYGIRARISSDQGETWGDEIILRDDGGCGDLGYPRVASLPDGTLIAAYYFNQDLHGERFIGGTIWKP
jgi:hypothetical protein